MAVLTRNNIVTNGLVLALDAANRQSYVSGSTTWYDISGNNNSGSLINGPIFDSNNGGSILFDGINDYATGTITPLSGSAFTIGTWIKPITLVSQSVYLSIGSINANNSTIHLRFYSDTFFRFGMYSDDLDAFNFSPATGKWNYIVCTLDNSKLQSIYQNGFFKSSRTSNNMFIGNNLYSVGRWFNTQAINANIGIVQVYNRALSAAEVLQNYNATKSRFGI